MCALYPKRLLLVAAILFMTGCGIATERYVERPKQDDIKGPGIFSGADGEFKVNELFSEEKERAGGGYYILDVEGSPPMTEEEFKEFESFRAWILSKEAGTDEYKEYESWKAFQQYRQSQSQ